MKYKYYLKKPKGEIVKDIFKWLAVGGVITVAAMSPSFGTNLLKAFVRGRKHGAKKTCDVFYRLRREGCIQVEKKDHQVFISLTEEGKRRAGWLQINDLRIHKPKKWDGKWRILMFDITEHSRMKRDALRGIIKRLNLQPLQKSVWIYPYEFLDELELLTEFFGFSTKEVRYIVTEEIGDDHSFRKLFTLEASA